MRKNSNYHTTPHKGGWQVKKAGSNRATSVHRTQSDAWSETKRLARGSSGEAVLHGKNGQFRARNTYGKDPFPPRG